MSDKQGSSPAKATVVVDRYKTRPCRNYMKHGACPYEGLCMFAHGDEELRTHQMNVQQGITTQEGVRAFQRNVRFERQQHQLQLFHQEQQRQAQQQLLTAMGPASENSDGSSEPTSTSVNPSDEGNTPPTAAVQHRRWDYAESWNQQQQKHPPAAQQHQLPQQQPREAGTNDFNIQPQRQQEQQQQHPQHPHQAQHQQQELHQHQEQRQPPPEQQQNNQQLHFKVGSEKDINHATQPLDDPSKPQPPQQLQRREEETTVAAPPLSRRLSAAATTIVTDEDTDRRCVLCKGTAERRTCLVPCGHACVCATCAEGLQQCPMCRMEIAQKITVFF